MPSKVSTLESIEDEVRQTVSNSINSTLDQFIHAVGKNQFEIDDDNIMAQFNGNIFRPETLKKEDIEKVIEKLINLNYLR